MMVEETLDGAVEGVDPEIEMVGREAMGSLDQEVAEDGVTAQSATTPDVLAELAVSESGVPEAGAGEAESSDAGESDVEDVTAQGPEAGEAEPSGVIEADAGEAEVSDAGESDVEDVTAQESEAGEAEPSGVVEADAGEAEVSDAGESEAEEVEVVQRPEGTAWYVVHSYSGYENKVRKNLEHRIESMGMRDQIFQVIVPTEEEVELRDGQRRTTERRVFPGYILVEMLLNDDTWHAVRNTPGVTDFVRSGDKPVPLRPEEVDKILRRMEAGAPQIKVRFREGQQVRIIEGPFEDFIGTVNVIDAGRARVRVLVSMFGRETPVEVDFLQVERV
jgi:transcriptional antiterminator NusG